MHFQTTYTPIFSVQISVLGQSIDWLIDLQEISVAVTVIRDQLLAIFRFPTQ